MSAQDKIDAVADSQQNSKLALRRTLGSPGVLHEIFSRHPAALSLPEHERTAFARRIAEIAYTSCVKNPSLFKCTPQSIVASVIEAAQLGLSVDGVQGHAYLVPYKGEATMQLGYRGMAALAYRSDLVQRIHADVIKEGDTFVYEEGTQAHLRHSIPLTSDRGETIGAYALCLLKGAAAPMFRVLPIAEVIAHRERSSGWQAFKRGQIKTTPWETDFDAMAAKTALRMLAKFMPSETLQRAAARDEDLDHGRARTGDEITSSVVEMEESHGETADVPQQ